MISWEYILLLIFLVTIKCEVAPNESEIKDFILCKNCGADLADPYYLFNKLSVAATALFANQTLFGKDELFIQRLFNPFGTKFEIVTTKKAKCAGVGNWHGSQTWFPGFAWRYCICTQCGAHMGWIFEPQSQKLNDKSPPTDNGFYALILENTLSEAFLDSFMITPKLPR